MIAPLRPIPALAVTVLSVCLAGTLDFGIADLCKNSGSVLLLRAAVRLTPGDATAWAGLAAKVPDMESGVALRRAVSLNPHDSAFQIQLALMAERAGDLPEARARLNRAIENDLGALPLWTLANFRIRQNEANFLDPFYKALKLAVAGSQDTTPFFDLLWRVNGDLGPAMNDTPCLRAYLKHLLDTGRTDSLANVALRLALAGEPRDHDELLLACDYLQTRGRQREAFAVWTAAGMIRDVHDAVFNGGMAPPLPIGFDWKFNSAPAHTITFEGGESGARFEVTGDQPDLIDLLNEPISLIAGGTYRLEWEAKGAAPTAAKGLSWAIAGSNAGVALTDFWIRGETLISIPPDTEFSSLILRLERTTGGLRYAGAFAIRKVRMSHVK